MKWDSGPDGAPNPGHSGAAAATPPFAGVATDQPLGAPVSALSAPGRLRCWVLAVRPKTLTIAVVPVLVGCTLAWVQIGRLDLPVLLATLLGAVLIQIGTNLHNDAADAERGADATATRLGPPRVTSLGWLPAAKVHRAAMIAFALALGIGVYLVAAGGWIVLLIGLASIAAGLAYTGGPRPIAYGALGEIFVWLFFGVLAVLGTHYLQAGRLDAGALLAGALIGLPASAVLVVNNYRDLEGDARVGKFTLAVRAGRPATRVVYALLMLAAFPLWPLVSHGGYSAPWAHLPWLVLPWGIWLVRRFFRETPGPVFNALLASTARFQFVQGVLVCLALVLSGTG